MKNRIPENKDRRPTLVRGLFLLLALIFLLVAVKSHFSRDDSQGRAEIKEEPTGLSTGTARRNIYDRNFVELAVTFQRSSIYAKPLELEAPEKVAEEVARILDQDERSLLSQLKGERSFAWLGQDVPREKAVRVTDLNFKGVYRTNQVQRFYPGKQLGAHVLGFLKDEQGLAGVEFYYDGVLRGGGGHEQRLNVAGVNKKIADGSESASLVLTIDAQVQANLEQKLKNLAVNTGAKSGVAVLMAPATGEIIALASLPDFDPNRFWEFSDEARRNRATEVLLPAGGMEHFFRHALALDKKLAAGAVEITAPETGKLPGEIQKTAWNQIQPGRYLSGEGLDLVPAVAVSAEELRSFMAKLGIAAKTEIDLPGAPLSVVNGVRGAEPGESATPLTLLTAFSRLLNGGQPVVPHVLRAVWHGDQLWFVPGQQGSGLFSGRPDLNEALRVELARVAGAGRSDFFIESLTQKEPQGQPQPEPEKALPGRVVAGVKEKEGNKAKQPSLQAGFDSILLGVAPVAHPEMAIIVALEGARLDTQSRSPVRSLAEEILPQARMVLQKTAKPPNAWELAIREIGHHKKMEQAGGKPPLPEVLAQGTTAQVMPDLHGLSGRKAMQVMQPYGLRLKLAGSGRVTEQKPMAGAQLRGMELCVLQLKPSLQ